MGANIVSPHLINNCTVCADVVRGFRFVNVVEMAHSIRIECARLPFNLRVNWGPILLAINNYALSLHMAVAGSIENFGHFIGGISIPGSE